MLDKRKSGPRSCTQKTTHKEGRQSQIDTTSVWGQGRLEEPETKRSERQGKEISGRGYSMSKGNKKGRFKACFWKPGRNRFQKLWEAQSHP